MTKFACPSAKVYSCLMDDDSGANKSRTNKKLCNRKKC